MRFERITEVTHPDFDRAFALYQSSFPLHEQRTLDKQKGVLSNPAYHFELVYQDEAFVGILLCWEHEHFIYVEHFAIHPDLRGGGFGSKTLEQLAERGKALVLEIDPPVDQVAINRQHFYEKAGFAANPWPHIHPPYRPDFHGHPLVVMTYPRSWDKKEYEQFAAFLGDVVMEDCKDICSNLEV